MNWPHPLALFGFESKGINDCAAVFQGRAWSSCNCSPVPGTFKFFPWGVVKAMFVFGLP